MWFILRNKSDGSKQLEYYENERKSTVTNAVPKGIIYLNNVMLVQRLPEPDKKTQFMMTFTGTVQYRHFDAPSEYNMEEWVTSLNSIIFSKIIGKLIIIITSKFIRLNTNNCNIHILLNIANIVSTKSNMLLVTI